MKPRQVGLTAAALLASGWAVRDYRAWRALGPGGLPHTPLGWLTMELLRIRAWRVDPFDTTRWAGTGHLTGPLPVRQGPRPAVARYPIPHRQLDQLPDPQFTPSLNVASFVAAPAGLDLSAQLLRKAQ